jgi:two-component system, NarL family, nitrate/nitrite sensor histidine kinase NarX
MRWRGQLSTKFMITGLVLLVLALTSIGLTLWVTRQLDGGAAAVNEAGRMRMQTWRLVSAVQSERPPEDIQWLVAVFDGSLGLLREGDVGRPLFVPWNEETRARMAELETVWQEGRGVLLSRSPDDAIGTALADRMVEHVDGLVLAIEQQLARLTALLNVFQFAMMALAVAGAMLALYVVFLFVINPLQRLRDGLRRIEAGDFSARVDVNNPDEFGEVASGFNHMADRLQAMYHGMEEKVRSKTLRLEMQRSRLEALYEVSTFVAQADTLDALAKGFAQKIRRLSQADGVAIRWTDEGSQRYVMLASDCLPTELVEAERSVEPGLCACGQPHATARTRVIPIQVLGPKQHEYCIRVGYQSLVSIPIRLHQRILGEIDLFYLGEKTLKDEEQGLLDALASHLANAVENLRTQAVSREAAVSEERTMLARELHDSIAQSLSFLKIQMTLLRSGLGRQDDATVQRALDELEAGIRESTNDVRELLVHFRTRTNGDDIEQALRTTLNKFEHQSGLHAHLSLHGHGVELPSDVQLQVLHIVQEALSNVRKHAEARDVYVMVEKEPRWRIVVRDNGCGFEPVAPSETDTHVGLHIMRERAERIGAQVAVRSSPGAGTEVEIELAI